MATSKYFRKYFGWEKAVCADCLFLVWRHEPYRVNLNSEIENPKVFFKCIDIIG